MKEIMTVEEVAAYLRVTERSIRTVINEGKLKAYKQFGRWYIFGADLMTFIKTGQNTA
jgi:excisionase family DNA binding protein